MYTLGGRRSRRRSRWRWKNGRCGFDQKTLEFGQLPFPVGPSRFGLKKPGSKYFVNCGGHFLQKSGAVFLEATQKSTLQEKRGGAEENE